MNEQFATIARDNDNHLMIRVPQQSGEPFFMLYSEKHETATKFARISFREPRYVGTQSWILSHSEKEQLVNLLKSNRYVLKVY